MLNDLTRVTSSSRVKTNSKQTGRGINYQIAMEIEAHITERFEVQKLLGKGAYGYVWQVAEKQSNRVLALKKIFDAFMNEIDAQRTYREVKYLFKLKGHENIIRLEEVIRSTNKADIYLVFELMDADLHFAIKDNCLGEIHKKVYHLSTAEITQVHTLGWTDPQRLEAFEHTDQQGLRHQVGRLRVGSIRSL